MPCVSDPWLAPGLRTRSIFNRVKVRVQENLQVQVRVQVRIQRFVFFEFKFELEFGKNGRVRLQV